VGGPGSGAGFHYEPVPGFDRPLVERLGQYPRQPDLLWDSVRAIGRFVTASLVRQLFRIEVVGSVPDLPRLALMPNHQSHLDTLAILAVLPERQRRRITVLAARDYFFERRWNALAPALLGQAVAFDRHRYTELRRWTHILRDRPEGWFLAYPAGSRRRSDLHAGLVLVLARSGWPIVPVALSGMREAWPVDRRFPRLFRRVRVTFGEPVTAPPTRELLGILSRFWEEHG
jgi:1-acyl-sn-glycerol-3-phosphate acyltransferase